MALSSLKSAIGLSRDCVRSCVSTSVWLSLEGVEEGDREVVGVLSHMASEEHGTGAPASG